jgi:high affinity Mn2+ porin
MTIKNRPVWLLTVALLPLAAATAQPGAGDQGPDQTAGAATSANNAAPALGPEPERWNLYYQATSIGQYHGSFPSPYSSPFSLQGHPEAEASLTTTLFFGLRLATNTLLYFDPEIAGGRGFSGATGLANSPNGEMPRVQTATPKPYLARLYFTQDFGFGTEREATDSDQNQLAGSRPMTRYSITAGHFAITDFFDDNRYSHDPRTQFMGWAVMYNGAWDYAADTRGYTWGWVHEFHTRNWSVRYASAAMPRVANGERFDRQLLRDRSDVFEGGFHAKIREHEGAVRLLSYFNRFDGGAYADAIRRAQATGAQPDITIGPKPGTLKYGFGVSADQEILKDLGVFGRLGWNDGKTESFAFTAMDRLATLGVSLNGSRWHRPGDTAATALTVGGLSAVHAQYLAMGGYDFLIGDGALRYGPETSWETYYSVRVMPFLFATFGLDHVDNPAYNRDRGPVWIGSFRLHVETGKK